MNLFAKAAFLAAAGVYLGATNTQAAYAANDLLLGFDRVDNGGIGTQPADYVINLGNFQTSVGVGGNIVVNLSSLLSLTTFNTVYGSLGSGVSMSVVGGSGATSGRNLFATVGRGGAGFGNVPGSIAPDPIASAFMASGANDVAAMANGLNLSSGQSTLISQSDVNSFNTWVLSSTPPSYFSGTGIDPSAATGGAALYEDLYRAVNNVNGNGFDYLGYFTLDPNAIQQLTFTPVGVPEPGTYALLGVGGWLLYVLRRPNQKALPQA